VVSDWLAQLENRLADGAEEALAEALISLAFAAADDLGIPIDERRAAGRRALVLLAAGGNPVRGLDLDGRAVTALATDLETPARLEALEAGLELLRGQASGLPHVSEVLRGLADTPEVAWRAYAASVLAEELDEQIGPE
jgi:hypothetical protein